MEIEKEYKINEYLTLKLENGNTNIYVSGEHFDLCKFLMLNIPEDKIEEYDDITSIDEAAERLNWSENGQIEVEYDLDPETEFFGHCSNLQAWWENGYDTRILHRNLAFPLLKRLTEVGDVNAQEVFQEEIIKRFESGYPTVIEYLLSENYLEFLNPKEFHPSPQFKKSIIKLLKKGRSLKQLLRERRRFDLWNKFSHESIKSAFCDTDSNLLLHVVEYLQEAIYDDREFIRRKSDISILFLNLRRGNPDLVANILIKNYNDKITINHIIESRLLEILKKDDLEILSASNEIDFIGDFIIFLGENFSQYREWRVLFDWSYYNFPPSFYTKIRERAPHILEDKVVHQIRNGNQEAIEDIHYFGFLKFVSFGKISSLLESPNNNFMDKFFQLVELSDYTMFNYLSELGNSFNDTIKEWIIQKIEQKDPDKVKELIYKVIWLGWVGNEDLSFQKIIKQKSIEELKQDKHFLRRLINEHDDLVREGLINVSKQIIFELLEEEDYSVIREFQLLHSLAKMVSNPNTSDAKVTKRLKKEILKRIHEQKISSVFSGEYVDFLSIQDLKALFFDKKLKFVENIITILKTKHTQTKFYLALKILIKCGDSSCISYCQDNFNEHLEFDSLMDNKILKIPFNILSRSTEGDLLGRFKKDFFDLVPKHLNLFKLKLELLDSSYVPQLLKSLVQINDFHDVDVEYETQFYFDTICKIGTIEQIKEEIYKLDQQINLDYVLLLAYTRIFSKKEFWDEFITNIDYDSIHALENVYDIYLILDSGEGYYAEEEKVNILFRVKNRDLTGLDFDTHYGVPLLIPDSITNLKGLTHLRIHGFQLKTLPNWISNQTDLEYLDLSFNNITQIPENIRNLASLRILNLRDNNLLALPESIGNLTSLEELLLESNYDNKLRSLPESIGRLESLKKLNLRGNLLETLPTSFGNLKSLEQLIISSNKLIQLPETMKGLINLKVLDLSNNLGKNRGIPPENLSGLIHLEELNFSDNSLKKIPNVINELSNLKHLKLTTNQIIKLENLNNLNKLESLSLEYNKNIKEINGLDNLKELRNLNLGMNKITEITGLDHLKKLEDLRLHMNEITKIEGLNELEKLTWLDLNSNQIFELEGLNCLSNLEVLYLDRNNISEIKGLENLSCLNRLHIEDNPISPTLIEELGGFSSRGGKVYRPKKFVDFCREKIIKEKESSLEFVKIENKKYCLWNNFLDLSNLKIHSIKEIRGLETLKNLRTLILKNNKIKDIRELNVLKTLKNLDISNNEIIEIKGLESMQALEHLDLTGNNISEINGLEELKDLKHLNLKANTITEIKGLEELKNLEYLNLNGNQIVEIKGLGNLKKLRYLVIVYNPLPKWIFKKLEEDFSHYERVKHPQKFVEYCKTK